MTSETSFSVYSLGTSPGRLLVCDAEKNIYGSHYHIREPESSTIKLTAAEFVQCARKWKSKLLVLEVSLVHWDDCGAWLTKALLLLA